MTRQFCREKQGKNGHIFAKIRQCAQVAKRSDFYVFFPSKRRKRFVLLSWLSSQADNSPDKRPTKFSKRCCLLHTRRSGACCLRNVKSQTGISWSTSRFTATLLLCDCEFTQCSSKWGVKPRLFLGYCHVQYHFYHRTSPVIQCKFSNRPNLT